MRKRNLIVVFNNPNEIKIKNGQGLTNSKGILKQLIISSMMEDKPKTEYQCVQFIKDCYKVQISLGIRYGIRDRLWKIKGWEKFTKSRTWKLAKKILKRG